MQFKLRRLLYDEVLQMDKLVPNFKGARILGVCLNVMGLEIGKGSFAREHRALHRVILAWTQRNYLRVRRDFPKVAKACLGTGPDRHYLTLMEPSSSEPTI